MKTKIRMKTRSQRLKEPLFATRTNGLYQVLYERASKKPVPIGKLRREVARDLRISQRKVGWAIDVLKNAGNWSNCGRCHADNREWKQGRVYFVPGA